MGQVVWCSEVAAGSETFPLHSAHGGGGGDGSGDGGARDLPPKLQGGSQGLPAWSHIKITSSL